MADERELKDLIEDLEPDDWRENEAPFSTDMEVCHKVLFDRSTSREEKADALAKWLAVAQPCFFGRTEAKRRRIAFCVLTENDWERGDAYVRHRIELDRREWRHRASRGESHAFLIAAVSDRLAVARQSPALLEFARKLCDLYLGDDAADKIHHDELLLRIDSDSSTQWRRWKVGVNLFSSQGDGRWWRDHRFPGGIVFSMNSVGHMARHLLESHIKDGHPTDMDTDERARLVYWALPTAMRIIGPPADGSTRGTWLIPRGSCDEDRDPAPYEGERRNRFGGLYAYSENRYHGLYHTDYSIPSAYFDSAIWQVEDVKRQARDDLFFNYLHRLAEEDYLSMGLGLDILVEEVTKMLAEPQPGVGEDVS